MKLQYRPIPQLNLLCNKGGLGDSVARLPAVAYLLRKYPHVQKVNLIVQDYFVEAATELLQQPASRLQVYGYSEMKQLLASQPESTPGMMVDSLHHTTLHTHLTDHAFHTLVDEQVEHKDKLYLEFKDLDRCATKNYVVVTTGFTAAVREWLPGEVNKLVEWINEQGVGVVFLGKKESDYWRAEKTPTKATFRDDIVDYSRGSDLRDKTSIKEAAAYMAQAKAVVGVDNGLLHLAACTKVPIVAGFTTVKPSHRIPYRKAGRITKVVTPDEQLECRYCQSKMNFVYNFDLRNCYTGTYNCVRQMTAEKFIKELEKII